MVREALWSAAACCSFPLSMICNRLQAGESGAKAPHSKDGHQPLERLYFYTRRSERCSADIGDDIAIGFNKIDLGVGNEMIVIREAHRAADADTARRIAIRVEDK